MKQGASSHKRRLTPQRRLTWTGLVTILGLLFNLFPQLAGAPMPTASAHNLQTRMVYMFFDPATQACIDARMEGTTPPAGCNSLPPDWQAGDPVLLAGDELGVIIKVVPRDGTTTGVGGHIDFYVPNGVEVVDVGYMVPDGAGGFDKVAMKGQSPIAIGAGPIGAKATSQLIGLNDVYASTVSGISTTAVNPATGLHLGTIAGVYGDTGIFYATDPDTAYGSWQRSTGDSTANGCGSLAFNPTALGKTLVNNSGDTVVPCNKWDAEQLMAWGVKGGTFGVSAPIVDYGDGRGNAPWGFASGVGGPQSGYAWNFDWDEWQASIKDPAAMRRAMDNGEIGPWQRIQYDGDRVSLDQPGLISTVLGYANVDAGNLGIPVANLPPTESQTDFASPKAIRWAVGQLTAYRPEYAWVKIAVTDATAGITNASGCPDLRGDTFGGDAGGTDGGKDHLWRYYEPTEVKMNLCVAAGKPATEELVKSGDLFQYPVKIYNLQDFTLTDVVVKDTLGSGLAFVSAFPAPTTTALPDLTWNVGTLLPGQKFESLVTVKATSSGFLDNCVVITAKDEFGQALPPQSACDTTISGLYPYLVPSKTVRSPSVAPGGTVIYDVLVRNIGEGATGSPVTVSEFLPAGFTYDTSSAPIVYVNGALMSPTVNTTVPGNPVFTVPAAIQGGKNLTISFQAKVDPAAEPGSYCNSYSVTQNGVPITTGSAACVNVAGGKIGDTIWRDWDGDGTLDAGEEGIEGVTVRLYASDGSTLLATTTTDATGHYYFPGREAGTYVVEVNNGVALAGTSLTGDPDATCPATGCDNRHTVTLTLNQQYLTADFGYKPVGAGVIGDTVFEDVGNDGVFTEGVDTGIAGVTVKLYEDANGDGIVDPATDALVATTTTGAGGLYSFSGLAEGQDYIVNVNPADAILATYFGADPYQASTLNPHPVDNLSGSYPDADFGFWRVEPSSIGDQVFIDNDGNGLYDANVDSPLAGVTVNLYRDGQLVATIVSGPDGSYLFDNLGPGSYTVVVDATDPDVPGGFAPAISQHNLTLNPGDAYLDADFPFVALISKTVDKSYAQPGETLNFGIAVNYPGSELLTDVKVVDPLPTGVTFNSATAGGVYGPYVSQPGTPGEDTGPALGMAIYNNNNDTFRYRTWNVEDDPQFSAELLGANMGTRIEMMAGASSPTSAERVVAFMDDARHVFAAIWNGTAWAAVPVPPANAAPGRMTSAALTTNSHLYWGAAVAYEQSSGHLMLVWNDDTSTTAGTDDELRYVTREGGVWGTVTSLPAANQPQNLRLVARPNSDQLALVYSTAAGADYVRLWTGTAWGPETTLDTAGGALTSVNVAFETQSGRVMVVYGKPTATSTALFYRIWDGSAWSTEASITSPAGVTGQPQWVAIASDPFSDRIAVGVTASAGGTWLAVWNGAAWTNVQLATATPLVTTAQNVAVAFETFSGEVLAAYGVNSAPTAQVRYRTWSYNPLTQTGAWSAESLGPTATSGNPNVIMLTRSPTTNRIMMALNTSGSVGNYVSWDGNAWDEIVTEASANTQTAIQQPLIYLWNRASATDSAATFVTASPITAKPGDPITVKLDLKSSNTQTNVTPSLMAEHGSATCTTADTIPATVTGGALKTFTYICTPTSLGEIHFVAGATAAGGYTFPAAASNTVLVSANAATHVVTWDLGSNSSGVSGVTAANKYLYAFRGNTTATYWAYNTASSLWNNPLDPTDSPVNIALGGALTNDGVRYIYALQGTSTRVFLRYDTVTNAWDDAGIADLPGTTDKVVAAGGALAYLNGSVYAFLGNTSPQFWRYDVAGNAWTQMANAPAAVGEGGALTTDGINIYGFRGAGQKAFWRYNVATNTWTTLAPVSDNVKRGGALVYANGVIYAFRGDAKKNFWRYNIAGNTWTTTLAQAPENVRQGAALAFDGVALYAFGGDGKTNFWRYNIGANTWTIAPTVPVAPATVNWGGALTYLPTGDVSYTDASAEPTFITGVKQVTLRMTVTSDNVINNITANAPTYTATGGATATFSAATRVSPDDDISGHGDPVIYEWIATVTPGSAPGAIVFTLSSSLGASADTNSVLVSPVLTWQATVNDPAPAVIYNTAVVNEGSGTIQNVPSITTQTATSGSIGDYVWADLDGDGEQDAGEYGLAGVEVCVYDSDGVILVGCDTTDANGNYRISGLTPDDYVVRTDPATYPAGYLPTTPTSLSIMLADGQQYVMADFGLKAPGTGAIGDRIWLDADNDGVQDSGETGLPGINVTLEIWDGAGWAAVATTTTGGDGLYSFGGLIAGDYRVTVDQDSPVTSPYDPIGTYTLGGAINPTYDRDGTGTADVALVTLLTDTTAVDDVDFGYNWSGSIGDYVWWDVNADGNQNDGAPATAGISGAAVLLYADANGDGILDPFDDVQVGFAMTGANGAYAFANLPPGNYLVDVYEDSLTTDGLRDVVPTTPNVLAVSLDAGETYPDADFGYFQGARVEGNVFHDDDRNATFDAVETGLEGVTVTLTGPGPDGILGTTDDVEVATTDTDSDGHFFFIVPKGDYALSYSTTQTDGLGYPEATTPTRVEFYAYPGEDWHPTFDFGVDYPGTIGDRVWNDVNGDGVQDDGEPGIGGVTLTLYHDTSGDGNFGAGDKFFAATATDATGAYLFTGLSNGTYFVIVDPNTLPDGYDQTGDPGEPDEPCTSCDNQGTAVVSGGDVLTMDFGYQPPTTAHTVSGTIWNDADGDGVQVYGEPGISSVTVCLYDSAGVFVPTCTTTDADGHYAFPGVADGDYIVKVDPATLPSTAYTPTYDPTMPLDNQTPVTVAADVTNQNFGYREILGSISGTVCEGEGDGNGICDPPTEAGLSGVTVTLVYAGADGILGTTDDVSASTTTDDNGDYTFDGTTIAPANCTYDAGAYASCPLDAGLLPGRYQIVETNKENYISLADADGGNPDNISLALALGQNAVDQDFEDLIVFAGFIGDLVWWDINGDGIQVAGEPGIPGVTVELLQDGEVIETTFTDASGLYSFTNLPDGAYTVRIWEEEFTTSVTPGSGTLENWTASPVDQTTGDLDSDGHPTTHDAAVEIGEGEGTADVDFGFSIVSSYTVTKVLSEDSENPSRLGQPITFTISIENTGKTWISILPLQDSYNNTYLTYGFGPNFATPDTVDHVNDGVLNWTDLTALAPYGWGTSEIDGDLAPGATQVVEISFTARSDTSALGPNGVANTVTVSNALADPDGPDGPLPPLAPLVPSEPASAYVQIYTPTGVVLEWFDAAMLDGAMLVNWRTASEAGVLGFNVLRRAAAEAVFTVANGELILAQYPGEERGAAYAFRDEGLAAGGYTYQLQSIELDGSAAIYGEVTVIVQ